MQNGTIANCSKEMQNILSCQQKQFFTAQPFDGWTNSVPHSPDSCCAWNAHSSPMMQSFSREFLVTMSQAKSETINQVLAQHVHPFQTIQIMIHDSSTMKIRTDEPCMPSTWQSQIMSLDQNQTTSTLLSMSMLPECPG